jgi:hypothetical protein
VLIRIIFYYRDAGFFYPALGYHMYASFTYRAVVQHLPLFLVVDEFLENAGESGELVEATDLVPGLGGHPCGGVTVGVVQADATSQEKPPLILHHLLTVLQDVYAQQEGEQQLKTHAKMSKMLKRTNIYLTGEKLKTENTHADIQCKYICRNCCCCGYKFCHKENISI